MIWILRLASSHLFYQTFHADSYRLRVSQEVRHESPHDALGLDGSHGPLGAVTLPPAVLALVAYVVMIVGTVAP